MLTDAHSLKVLRQHIQKMPAEVAILGSGWKRVLENAKVETEISFKDWLGVEASVPGHEGKLVIAEIKGTRVAIMSGRLHMYEGYTARQATLPIRVLAQAGAKRVIVTAACGGINEKYEVGDFVILNDLLTLFLALDNPLVGPEFQDMSEVFDREMRNKMRQVMVAQGVPMKEGVYCYYHGPNFETPADKMALKFLGADVVGMSTVPETIMARRLGLKVVGVSFVTNLAFVKHDHKDVLAAAEASSTQMVKVLEDFYAS